ncbi:MAG: hypothetical protein LJI21_01695 [Wolbachia endosymbiont of Menacanthus eurysternus]|nr:MAG: hypothetical protein LJI21_01695 [Wolbachia endosymbiont of Menacanthus eurysternus]
MPIFKDHRGQFHKMNTALATLTATYAVIAAVAFSSPHWASSYPILAPLVAFTATSLGMFMLATSVVILTGLALYAISKNNEVSELKTPKLINYDGQTMLLLTRDVFEDIKENNKNNYNEFIENQYCIDHLNLNNKDYRITIDNKFNEEGNTLLFKVLQSEIKNSKNESFLKEKKSLEELNSSEKSTEKINTCLDGLSSIAPVQQEQRKVLGLL